MKKASNDMRRSERIERVAEARAEGKTLQTIADDEGVSLGQVQRDLDKAEKSGLSGDKPEPSKVTGKDGKKQSAKKKKKAVATSTEPVKQSGDEPGEKLNCRGATTIF